MVGSYTSLEPCFLVWKPPELGRHNEELENLSESRERQGVIGQSHPTRQRGERESPTFRVSITIRETEVKLRNKRLLETEMTADWKAR